MQRVKKAVEGQHLLSNSGTERPGAWWANQGEGLRQMTEKEKAASLSPTFVCQTEKRKDR